MITELQKCPECKQAGMLDITYDPEENTIRLVCLSSECLYERRYFL